MEMERVREGREEREERREYLPLLLQLTSFPPPLTCNSLLSASSAPTWYQSNALNQMFIFALAFPLLFLFCPPLSSSLFFSLLPACLLNFRALRFSWFLWFFSFIFVRIDYANFTTFTSTFSLQRLRCVFPSLSHTLSLPLPLFLVLIPALSW